MNDHCAVYIVVHEATLAVEELRTFWAKLPRFGEIWVERSDGSRVCALTSSRSAWLMYLRYEGDAGFSSRNPLYSGPSDAMLGFCLGNAQIERFPAAWTFSTDEILLALERFAVDGVFPSEIGWHNDSEGGAPVPVVR